jgi:hypothetical protein
MRIGLRVVKLTISRESEFFYDPLREKTGRRLNYGQSQDFYKPHQDISCEGRIGGPG